MPTIRDLPPETIEHIVTSAYSGEPATSLTRRARKRFLRAVALVGHVWTPFAQEALWKYVELDIFNVDSFIAAGPDRYPVQVLGCNFNLQRRFSNFIGTILGIVRGTKSLRLVRCSVDPISLCGDNLRELKSLELFHVELIPRGPITLSFSLTTLELGLCPDPGPSEFIEALSRQPSITYVGITEGRLFAVDSDSKRYVHTLARLAPRLIALAYRYGALLGGQDDGFVKHCTQLKHLTTYHAGHHSNSRLLVPLESWTESIDCEDDLLSVLDVLRSGSIAMSKLERLELEVEGVELVRSWEGWTELEDICRDRKIKLRITGVCLTYD